MAGADTSWSADAAHLWHGPHEILRKMKAIRQFNDLVGHHRPGNDGIIRVDKKGQVTFANHKISELLGYSSNALIGKSLEDLLALDPQSGAAGLMTALLEGEHGQRYEMVFQDHAQARIPAVVTGTSLFRHGDRCGSLLVVVDLRNRQQLAEGLQDAQVRLQQSSQELDKTLWELSVIKEVAHALQTTQNLDELLRIVLTGVTAEEGLGFNRAFLLLVDEKDKRLKGALAVGPSNQEEAERIWAGLRNHSQSLRELLERHRDASGQFDPGLNRVVREMEFDLMAPAGIVVHAVRQGQSHNVTRASQNSLVDSRLLTLLGTENFVVVPLIARGKPLGAVIADNCFTGRPIEDADVALLETMAFHASFAIERARLHERLVEKVTELEKAYADLQNSQDQLLRAERLSAVGRMATRLSHELRNPLVSIGGFARLISKNLPRGHSNQEHLGIIIDEVARLELMMTEVLDFVRPAKPSLEPVDLNGLVGDVMATMRPAIESRQISAHQDLEPDIPVLEVDPLQISQVLINLVRNGLEAMASGGSLWIRTQWLGDRVRIEVQDTGVGIPREHQDKLFSEFFTTKSAGVGLGLTIASQTVQNHGGSIEVESQVGKGSIFRLYLPASGQNR